MTIVACFQCPQTAVCKNDECFWRQRDVHGVPAFPVGLDLPPDAFDHLPEAKCPEMIITVGTNVLYIICKEYIGDSETTIGSAFSVALSRQPPMISLFPK